MFRVQRRSEDSGWEDVPGVAFYEQWKAERDRDRYQETTGIEARVVNERGAEIKRRDEWRQP